LQLRKACPIKQLAVLGVGLHLIYCGVATKLLKKIQLSQTERATAASSQQQQQQQQLRKCA